MLTEFILYLTEQLRQPYLWGGQHTRLTPRPMGFRWEPRFPFCIFSFYLSMGEPNKIPSRLFPSD